MKVFMLWDMEGASGIFTREELWFWEPGARKEVAERARILFSDDINNATRAALDAGVDELYVCDTHHGGGNMILERMLKDPRVTYLTSARGYRGKELRWMPPLDETFDGFMTPAHHAMAGTPNAFLPHSWMGHYADFRINGTSVGEMGIESCFAGHWNIPLAFMSGDELACAEARAMFPGIVAVAVKRPVDHDHCAGPAPEEAHKLMAAGVKTAVQNLRDGKCKPFAPKIPMTVTVRMKEASFADQAALRPGVERLDKFTVQGVARTRADVVKWLLGTGLNMEPPKPK